MTTAFSLTTACPVEAKLLSDKSKMMAAIAKTIQDNQWTQSYAAEKMSVTQPRVSNLLSGKIDKFSLDMLVSMARRAGVEIEINNSAIQ